MIDFGGGMIFPSSYDRDQFSAEQEARQEAGQAAGEARAELSADAHEEARRVAHRAAIDIALGPLGEGPIVSVCRLADAVADAAIDAYLEALNAH